MIREFTVSQEDGATEHKVSVDHKSYEALTDKERRLVFEKGLKSITIDVQRGLRVDLKNGVRGKALQDSAQQRWNKVWNGMKQTPSVVKVTVDAAVLGLSFEQCQGLIEQGVVVLNVPPQEVGSDASDEVTEEQ